ncbi:MAG: GreA/GreB family elongation factor [Burkholderiaceae bacterium]
MNLPDILSQSNSRAPALRVTLNSLVDYEEIPIGARHTIMLVPPKHADEREGRVSTFAPMGRALLGVRVGSIVDVPMPNGDCSCVQVMAVRTHAGDAR